VRRLASCETKHGCTVSEPRRDGDYFGKRGISRDRESKRFALSGGGACIFGVRALHSSTSEAAMTVQPTILCPVDFSTASAGALRYAATVAARVKARVTALAIEDPVLTEALDLGTGIIWRAEDCKRELASFVAKTFGDDSAARDSVECESAVGKPAAEILRMSRERPCDLIVMSSHGVTGARKLFFGSTTE